MHKNTNKATKRIPTGLLVNITEGFKAVRGNLLRATLTALIIAIGIACLVGILTAIDGIKASVMQNLSAFGGNSFEIRSKDNFTSTEQGKKSKAFEPLDLREALQFKEQFQEGRLIAISTFVAYNAEVKRLSEKTNPNIRIRGADENYLLIRGYEMEFGRNFSMVETQYGSNVAIIGSQLKETLFKENENPVNQWISFYGGKFKVVGVLKEEGGFGGNSGSDRSIFVPLETAARLAVNSRLYYNIDVEVANPLEIEQAMGEATGLMRKIRRDPLRQENSFEIEKNESAIETIEQISGYLQIGGFSIGFITLLGASIGLMNIMMVSVKERTREIGIRKAVGATPFRIRQQFLIEAIIICLMGGLGGIVLGLPLGNILASVLGGTVFVAPWFWMAIGILICIVVGIVSGYYPAHKASRVDPIESLRFE